MSKKSGFTLIELLVVIGVLATLAAVLLVAVKPFEQFARSRDAGRLSAVGQLGGALQRSLAISGGGYPQLVAGWQTNLLKATNDIAQALSVAQVGSSTCGGSNPPNAEGNICYSTSLPSNSPDAIVWTIAESQTYATIAGCNSSQVPAITWIASQGVGITCLASANTIPAPDPSTNLYDTIVLYTASHPNTIASSSTPTPGITSTPTPTQAPSTISLRATTTGNNGSGGTSLTLNKPAGTSNGDILFAHVVVKPSGNTINAPAGWTLITRQDSSSYFSTVTYWRLAGSSEPANYTWTFGSSNAALGGIASYIGVDTTNPIDASNTKYNNGSSNVDNAGITTNYANDMLVYAVGIVVATTVNVPTGFTQEWSTTSQATTSEMSQMTDPTIGPTGTIHATHNGGSSSNITHLIALKPAGAQLPTPTPAPSPGSTGFSFAAGGDLGGNNTSTATLNLIAQSAVNFEVLEGDLSYGDILPESSWCTYVKSHVGATFPFEIVSGNHESGGDGTGGGLIDNYLSCLPDKLGAVGTYGKEYYFDYPSGAPVARFIMISPNLTFTNGGYYDYSAGTNHYNWLSSTIDSARTAGIKWVIVGMHEDCISIGVKSCEIGNALMNLMVSKKVDVVLQGHEHNYQRSKQLAINGTTCTALQAETYNSNCVVNDGSTGTFTKGAGTIIMIAGMMGSPEGLVSVNTSDGDAGYFARWMGSNANPTNGFSLFTISADGSTLTSSFRPSAQGNFSDSFTIH